MCTGTEVLCMFQYLPPAPGDFIDVETGNVVGKHKGKNSDCQLTNCCEQTQR